MIQARASVNSCPVSFPTRIKRKVQIFWPLELTDYSQMEFGIHDCDGYVLPFAEEVEAGDSSGRVPTEGSRRARLLPWPMRLVTVNVPPKAPASRLAIDSPNPTPPTPRRRVWADRKNGVNR